MKISYTVHSANVENVAVAAKTADGRDVAAHVPGLVVEMVDGETHGHTFRFVPTSADDMTAHRELFAPGTTVVATFAKE